MKPSKMLLCVIAAGAITGAACSDPGGGPALDAGPADAAAPSCAPTCAMTVVSGSVGGGGIVDGSGHAARMHGIEGMASDGESTIFFTDYVGSIVRKLEVNSGRVTTLAGVAGAINDLAERQQRDGPGREARFLYAPKIALLGNYLYVLDAGSLRRIHKDSGQVETVLDPATDAPWQTSNPFDYYALASDGLRLYILQRAIWSFDPVTGRFEHLAGDPSAWETKDGVGKEARLMGIGAAIFGGGLHFADACVARRFNPNTLEIQTLAGTSLPPDQCLYGPADGRGGNAEFLYIQDMAATSEAVYLVERVDPNAANVKKQILAPYFGRIRRLDPISQMVQTVAGALVDASASLGERLGDAPTARLFRPVALAALTTKIEGQARDQLYVATATGIHRLSEGRLETIAGHYEPDPLIETGPVAADKTHLFIVDNGRQQLLRVDRASGVREVFGRRSEPHFPLSDVRAMPRIGDTLFLMDTAWYGTQPVLAFNLREGSSRIHFELPQELVAQDAATDGHDLYVAATGPDTWEVSIFKTPPDDGSAPERVFHSAELTHFRSFAVLDATLYIAAGHRLSKVRGDQLVPLAGGETAGCRAGVGAQAQLSAPHALATDGRYLYLGDVACHKVSRVDPQDGAVVDLVGDPNASDFSEGRGSSAHTPYPRYLAVDSGFLFVSDAREGVVMKIGPLR